MAATLLQPPDDLRTTLTLSQRAKSFFASQSRTWTLPYPLSLLVNNDSQEKWAAYENLFLACLVSGDDAGAYLCLEELTGRFGKLNEHVLALRGLYEEATAKSDAELQAVMTRYEDILKEDPTIFSIQKRRVALLRSMGKPVEAIAALVTLLDNSPTDAEAWAELSDLYFNQGMYEQAIYCLEEVLLIMPNAWNMQARLAEILFVTANRAEIGSGDQLKMLSDSMRRFCRSVELCDDYLRGYYGLKVTTGRLLEALSTSKKGQPSNVDPVAGDLAPPTVPNVKKLNELATAKLAEIVRKSTAKEKGWDGYDEAELKAAQDLLNDPTRKVER
ncbi:hypothetical protein M433DRAFT_75985 [Acidomyces richmondensis BFW]|nr:MAG: hypothetical protein FE78DRAFT_28828 [Acidomyces sp. 'richmondensis']KYG41384.1 hypothetical protein M433DRAFT_75985 [Acidomyces richmondensis BFW]